MSDYPEHDKLRAVSDQTQAAAAFITWLESQRIHLGRTVDGHNYPQPVFESLSTLLAAWQGIDQNKLEAEKRQILAAL